MFAVNLQGKLPCKGGGVELKERSLINIIVISCNHEDEDDDDDADQ